MFNFLKKKDAEIDDNIQESNDNDIKRLRTAEPNWKGIKRKYIYYVLLFFAFSLIYAVTSGLEDDKNKAENKELKKTEEFRDSKPIQGEHLINIPKDYREQADIDAKNKKKAEKEKEFELEEKKNKIESPSIPQRPRVPETKYNRYELSPAEKSKLEKEELRKKALSSPISFDLKERQSK